MTTPASRQPAAGASLWSDAIARVLRNRAAVAGGIVVASMALAATAFGPIARWGTRFTHNETHVCLSYHPPGARAVPREFHRLRLDGEFALGRIDADGDGAVDAAELTATIADGEFGRYDRDRDGWLGVDEFRRVERVWLAQTLEEAFSAFDADGDDRLDRPESHTFVDIYPLGESGLFVRTHDTDGDGKLGPSEYPGTPAPAVMWLGSDGLGRDVLTRLVFGARISLAVGLVATLVSLVIGVAWGAIAGYAGGRVDAVMMRIVDIIYGLPFMFLVILLMVVFGQNIILIFVAIGAVEWLTMARIVRGQVISLKNQEFVLAAQSIGASTPAIVFRHLIPNALGPIIVYATLTVPAVMLTEAFLSFIGLGVQAPDTSWGAMASEGAAPGIMTSYPWMILAPGLALAVTLLSLNFVGDGLRDALDPRGRRDT